MTKSVYELEMHEFTTVPVPYNTRFNTLSVMRVPGGWIYNFPCWGDDKERISRPVFVPFHQYVKIEGSGTRPRTPQELEQIG